jgi:hypothetical protein
MLPLLCLLIYICFRFTMTFALGFTMVKSMGGDIPQWGVQAQLGYCLILRDGRSHDSSAQRLDSSEAQDKEMELADKRSANFTDRRRPDQVPQTSPPFLPNSTTLSEAIRRRAGPEDSSAKAPVASGGKNTQDQRTNPRMKATPATPLETPTSNGARALPPGGRHPRIIASGLLTRSQVTGWNPLEGFTKSSCGKLRLGGMLPASNSKKG